MDFGFPDLSSNFQRRGDFVPYILSLLLLVFLLQCNKACFVAHETGENWQEINLTFLAGDQSDLKMI